jgi:hypothetical protein
VAVEVRATPLANKIIEELPGRPRRAYDQFESVLAARGCAALAYRLSGSGLDHLCVVHLTGTLRVIVAFESADVAYVVLVGNHDSSRPRLDIYRQLYTLAGAQAPDQAGRSKPPCCDAKTGKPPVNAGLVDYLLTRMRRFRASDLRSSPGRRRRGQ